METPKGEQFRDSIGTINKEGKRSWVFPKKPSGIFYKYRSWVSYFLLVVLLSSPFIKINGNLKKYTSYIRDQLINTNELKKAEKNVEKKLTKS